MNVLVTGGTGNLGRELVPRLLSAGSQVSVLSRRPEPNLPPGVRAVTGDLTTGAGIDEALEGAEVIVHCASGTGTIRGLMYRSARRTDVEATQRLLHAAKGRGRPHLVYISIVGIDKIPLGYYRAKHETEAAIESSGLLYTILRTTQWHTLAAELCERLTSFPLVLAPKGVRLQLLDPGEVADRMISLIQAGPSGRAAEMGGPEAIEMKDVLRTYAQAVGKRRSIRTVSFPGKTMRALRKGHNLSPGHADGRIGWSDWLRVNAAVT